MFDFTPVGLAVAAAGVAFVALAGWRLVPARRRTGAEGFDTGAYLTEARVPEDSRAVGMPLGNIEAALGEADAQVVGLVRNDMRLTAPSPGRVVRAGDILVIEAETAALTNARSTLGLKLEEAKRAAPPEDPAPAEAASEAGRAPAHPAPVEPEQTPAASDEIVLTELAVLPGSALVGRSASDIRLRTQYGLNLLAVSRQGRQSITRLQTMLASMALRTVPPRSVDGVIDWPVIVLLAALIPVAGAMERTGAADLLARFLLEGVARGHPIVGLAVVLVVTMTLSDLMNNAATAAVMCPVAIGTAAQLGVSADPFLMAVAIGASCAFLTPIGHQNNTLILGPGGFRFGDYWRLGLPLEVLVAAVTSRCCCGSGRYDRLAGCGSVAILIARSVAKDGR
jgi:di/tricarboxylate transporter